uniref:RNase H type-1 domain-containing protein n=1 Tax=Cannabis sativa TaxID=3483 RepID=A0A803PVI6_CANSA
MLSMKFLIIKLSTDNKELVPPGLPRLKMEESGTSQNSIAFVIQRHILSNALPIRTAIAKRMQINDTAYPLSGVGEETMEHLFHYSNFAYYLWKSSPWGLMPIMNLDTIWRARNDKVHNNNLSCIIHYIDSIIRCYANYGSQLFTSPTTRAAPHWSPLLEDWIKIIFDVKVGSSSMSVVALARDHLGTVLWVASNMLIFCDALIGEVAACHPTFETAVKRKHNFVIIESDSETIIKALQRKVSVWSIDNYVLNCNRVSRQVLSCNFAFIPRLNIFAAHNIVKWVFAQNLTGMVDVPTILTDIICNDHKV